MGALTVAVLWASILSSPAFAATGRDALDRGDPDAALAELTPVVDAGGASATDLYHAGLAWHRKGDIPRAIRYWREAKAVSPRSGDISHNLALARSQAKGTPRPAGAPRGWLELISAQELSLLSALSLAGSAVGAVRTRTVGRWVVAWAVGVVLAVLALDASNAWRTHGIAVVVDGPAAARAVARADAAVVFTLAPGSEVAVERRLSGFLAVRDGDGRVAFVPDGAVAVIDPR